MQVELKRIRKASFDDVMKNVVDKFNKEGVLCVDCEYVEKHSENILIKGKKIVLEYSVDKYEEIVKGKAKTYNKLANIGMLLHRETKDINGNVIPQNILYEKEVWAYLSLTVFFDIVKQLRLEDDNKMSADKIERFYFNVRTVSRTGLLFVWSMIDIIEAEYDKELAITAFQFIDPVKAIYERTISRNYVVLKAYVQAIINCKKDPRIKNKKYKVKVPNGVSCFARMNIFDAYPYEELVSAIKEKIEEIINM